MPARPRPAEAATRRVRLAALGAYVLGAAACADGPSGPAPTRAVTLCAFTDWFAYRNEGGAWTQVRSGTGAHGFDATERLSIAWARHDPRSPHLRIEHVTAAQAQAMYPCTSGGTTGAATAPGMVHGTLRGLADGDYADVSWGDGSHASTSWTEPAFQLFARSGSHDLIATRFPTRVSADRVDRVVVRRAQAYAAGATVTVDFAAAEALAPAEHALRFDGPRSSVQVNFLTASGNDHVLQATVVGEVGSGEQSRATTLLAMPASLVAPGDVHQVSLGDGERSVQVYARTPRDLATSYGPPASEPAFATVSRMPHPRVRATIPAQPEYGAVAYAFLQQPTAAGSARLGISMYVSREHLGGTPRAWTLELPDLARVEGWNAITALRDAAFEWTVFVSGRPLLFEPRDAADGLVLRSAYARGAQSP